MDWHCEATATGMESYSGVCSRERQIHSYPCGEIVWQKTKEKGVDMSEDMNDIQIVLKEAVKLLDEHGWIQGEFGNVDRGFCSLGAIRTAGMRVRTEREWPNYPAVSDYEVEEALEAVLPVASIVSWNDNMKRPFRKFRIKRKFRQAIKKAGKL